MKIIDSDLDHLCGEMSIGRKHYMWKNGQDLMFIFWVMCVENQQKDAITVKTDGKKLVKNLQAC